jgi:peptidoglycan hydrolase-like protein with peptidoglycan-binding domain
MKRSWAVLILFAFAAFGVSAVAQQPPPASQNNPQVVPATPGPATQPPTGTKVTKRETDTLVQPEAKPVKITPRVVRNAQAELKKRGYYAGPVDGIYGPGTRASVRKFQAAENLPKTGQLDLNTMEKLNVGGVRALAAAPADVGRGGKAFGHDMKGGHPVAAGKAMGSGAVSSGKKVAKGSESLAKRGVEKAGSGLSKLGHKIEGKSEGQPQKNPPPQSGQNPPPR